MIDANLLESGSAVECDICIVGAGLAGLTLAREFIGTKWRVCLLESGGRTPDKETQQLQWGENVGHPYYSLDTARPRYLGGSVNRWHVAVGEDCRYARMRPLDAIDFEKRDWIPYSGWPFDKQHLDPFYDRAQSACMINPATFDVAYWEGELERTRLRLEPSDVETVIFKFGAKEEFTQNHVQEIESAGNVETYIYANVVEIVANNTKTAVSQLRAVTTCGKNLKISAKTYVMAAGAIENARLLLVSDKDVAGGLGNEHGNVGRFFMEHPHFDCGILVPFEDGIFQRMRFYTQRNARKGTPVTAKTAISAEACRKNRLTNHVIEFIPITLQRSTLHRFPIVDNDGVRSLRALKRGNYRKSDFGKHLKSVLSNLDQTLLAAYREARTEVLKALDRHSVNVFLLHSMCEQIPNPESRVFLTQERDSLGVNRVALDWQVTPDDIRAIVLTLEVYERVFKKGGVGKFFRELYEETPNLKINGGWHHMGTTRICNDRKYGVVDENCQVHGVSDLYIAGPSVFPTGGYANPALTIVAMTIRLADHLKNNLA